MLGPLLFAIFINDIDNAVDVVSCHLLKFPGNIKCILRVNTHYDAFKFQADLDKIFLSSVDWQMSPCFQSAL